MADERWRLSVAEDRCVGSGVCAASASHRFYVEDGLAHPEDEVVDADPEVLGAAESCPMEAIFVRVEASGELLTPPE
ncbi:ferredoxin [Streptomyces sp. NPDC002537]